MVRQTQNMFGRGVDLFAQPVPKAPVPKDGGTRCMLTDGVGWRKQGGSHLNRCVHLLSSNVVDDWRRRRFGGRRRSMRSCWRVRRTISRLGGLDHMLEVCANVGSTFRGEGAVVCHVGRMDRSPIATVRIGWRGRVDMSVRLPESVERTERDFGLLEHIVYASLVGVHVGIVANHKLVARRSWYHARARAIAPRQNAECRQLAEDEPRRRLLGEHGIGIQVIAHGTVVGGVHRPMRAVKACTYDGQRLQSCVGILDRD